MSGASVGERRFPIQVGPGYKSKREPMRSIPWELIELHEEQALRNHGGQTLKRLAERAGLDSTETIAVLTDRDWSEYEKLTPVQSNDLLAAIVIAWDRKQ